MPELFKFNKDAPFVEPDFGLLRALLHGPKTPRSWRHVLLVLDAIRRADAHTFAHHASDYARRILATAWPLEVQTLSLSETDRIRHPEHVHLLPFVTHGVKFDDPRALGKFVRKHPEAFVARAEFYWRRDERLKRAMCEVLESSARVRGLRLERGPREILEALGAHEQPYLTWLDVTPESIEQFELLCTFEELVGKLQHLAVRGPAKPDGVCEVLSAQGFESLTSFLWEPSITAFEHAERSSDALWERLVHTSWFGRLESLTASVYRADHLYADADREAWRDFCEVLAAHPTLRHLTLLSWRSDLEAGRMTVFARALERSSLQSVTIRSIGLYTSEIKVLLGAKLPASLKFLSFKARAPRVHEELCNFPDLSHLEGVKITLQDRGLNKLVELLQHPHRGEVLDMRAFVRQEVFLDQLESLEVWQHIRDVRMPHDGDWEMRRFLESPRPPSLRRIDLRRMKLSLGMWSELWEHPLWQDDRVKVLGDAGEHHVGLQTEVAGLIEGRSQSLTIPAEAGLETLRWTLEQPWCVRVEELDIRAEVHEVWLPVLTQAYESGRFQGLKRLILNNFTCEFMAALEWCTQDLAQALDRLTLNPVSRQRNRWLMGEPTELRVMSRYLTPDRITQIASYHDTHPVTALDIGGFGQEVEAEVLEQLSLFRSLESLRLGGRVEDGAGMLRQVLGTCPELRHMEFFMQRTAIERFGAQGVFDALLTTPGVERLETLRVYFYHYEHNLEFQRLFKERFNR